MTRPARILIVDADDAERNLIRQALDGQDYKVEAAVNFSEADLRLVGGRFDLIISGAGPALERVEFIQRVRATPALAGILILVIAEWGEGQATLALSNGADGYEPLPFDAIRMITSIERLLQRQVAASG